MESACQMSEFTLRKIFHVDLPLSPPSVTSREKLGVFRLSGLDSEGFMFEGQEGRAHFLLMSTAVTVLFLRVSESPQGDPAASG